MTRANGSLDVLALDLVGQFLDRVARLVEERVRLERLAIGLERILLLADCSSTMPRSLIAR